MQISKSLRKATPLLKMIAIILFVVFLFVGIYFGMRYQKKITSPTITKPNMTEISSDKTVVSSPDNKKLPHFTTKVQNDMRETQISVMLIS